MQLITPLFYAYLISDDNLPFLDRISEMDPAYSKERPLYLDFADLSARSTWSIFSPENDGIPHTLWLIEGAQDMRTIDIYDQPYGVAIEHIITPASTHLLLLRKQADKDVFVLYRGVEQVAKELAAREKPNFDALLRQYWMGAQQSEHLGRS